MKVIALKSFVSRMDGRVYRPAAGDVLEMPEGADWLRVGLVGEESASGELASGAGEESASGELASGAGEEGGAAALAGDGDSSGGIAGDGDGAGELNTDGGNTDGGKGDGPVSPDVAILAKKKKGKGAK